MLRQQALLAQAFSGMLKAQQAFAQNWALLAALRIRFSGTCKRIRAQADRQESHSPRRPRQIKQRLGTSGGNGRSAQAKTATP